MRLTDQQVIAARSHGRMTGRYAEEALAIEVQESRAEIARLTKERDEERKWERLHEVELNRTMLVLGHRFTLVPPDGGNVRPREAAKSAIDALAAAEARVAELTKERDEANAAAEAHEVKWRSICKAERSDGGMCACSYDKPDDVCAFHSPKIAAAETRIAKLEAALRQADEWFRAYAQGHYAKGDWDKAKRNHDRADYCNRAALGRDKP
jgi:hypothetical protein